jgi:hypothetical protein
MFASLLRPKKSGASETTPLLAALSKFRNRRNGEAEEADDNVSDVIVQYEDEDEEEDDDRGRDGSLLPVFSPAFLGMLSQAGVLVYLTNKPLQIAYPSTTRPTLSV